MSRLDSAIRRLEAQRLCLDEAAVLVAGRPGHILEIGLGNGRTYDHLRCLFPERDIYCFDRRIAAHPDCIPDDGHMFLGDLAETLPLAAHRLGPAAVLAHADIGSGDRQASLDLAIRLAGALPPLLARGAVIIGDQPLPNTAWTTLDLPAGVAAGRYHMYRTAPLAGA